MPDFLNRRSFLKTTAAATAAAGTATFSINAVGANERVVLAVMGIRGRGNYLAPRIAGRDDVELRYLADPDSRLFDGRSRNVAQVTGRRPECVQDFRHVLDDPEVDGVVMATPDHWHALGTVWACQAGKDVYVEKPTSHSIWESRKMVEAARKYERVVQVGAQNHSDPYLAAAKGYIDSEAFGPVHFVRVLNSKVRGTIGYREDQETPEGVDYDMWLGPAPMRRFNENHFHYSWNWLWNYSGGDICNDGIHQIDIARTLIDRPYPDAVSSGGGIHFFDDDQETPDTHTVTWEYPGLTMVFEQTLWTPYMLKTPMEMRDEDNLPNWPFSGTRIEIYGENQFMYFGRHGGGWEVFDKDGESVQVGHGHFTRMEQEHIANFVDCIRTRQRPNADIEMVHHSTLLSHYGNAAYRTGRRLKIDPATEGFVDDAEANALVKREYREPWVVPEEV